MKHDLEVHTQCQKQHCCICDGGLAICTICFGAESSLTTECCGVGLQNDLRDDISHGCLDFKHGKWERLK